LSFEGASGGACTALSVSAAVHGFKPIRWFFRGNSLLLFRELSTRLFGMLSASSSYIRYLGVRYYSILQNICKEEYPEMLRTKSLVLWCSNARTMDAIPMRDFPTKESFGEALQGTAYIPGMICEFKNWFFLPLFHNRVQGVDLVVDGGLSEVAAWWTGKPNPVLKHAAFPKKSRILFFETWPRPWTQSGLECENVVKIQLWRWNDYTYKDIIIWGNEQWAKDLYLRGYETAVENMGEINEKLTEFFYPPEPKPA